jgi:hypothetical protein
MQDLLREGIITVNKNTGELTVLKELSENNLNVSSLLKVQLHELTSHCSLSVASSAQLSGAATVGGCASAAPQRLLMECIASAAICYVFATRSKAYCHCYLP